VGEVSKFAQSRISRFLRRHPALNVALRLGRYVFANILIAALQNLLL
jgi:hypothetical protein